MDVVLTVRVSNTAGAQTTASIVATASTADGNHFVDRNDISDFRDRNGVTLAIDRNGNFLGV